MTAAAVLAPIEDELLQIKNLTQSYDPSLPSFLNTLSSLSVNDDYWLKVSENVSLDVEGVVYHDEAEEAHIDEEIESSPEQLNIRLEKNEIYLLAAGALILYFVLKWAGFFSSISKYLDS